MSNVNPETGIRYGVTSLIPDWILEDSLSWDCPDETECRAEYARETLQGRAEKGDIAPDDIDGFEPYPGASESEKENRGYLVDYIGSLSDQDAIDALDSVDCNAWDVFWDGADFSESARYGEEDGIKMMLSSLGGAPLLWVFFSPYLDMVRLCSPCVPNAGDLDSPDGQGYQCYALNPEWYGEEDAGMFD
jgi:hypothetical protein